ncbi:MAG: isoleucine--tRNA ligase [Rhodospirillales bacterium]|nr:isoleucine--tRNA ligase [Rhodospirillales bacterium]
MSVDYKETVFLPKTDFPMRAGLPKREPEFLQRWQDMGLFEKLRETSKGREKFILHDGPPYANGHLHVGHALNKILKDIINRNQQMLGKDAHYVPGWDCHGLPIEWKIEEKYRAKGQDKDDVSIVDFRHECREFAQGWLDIQREEFKRLGIEGDWDHPYSTMTFKAEAQIAKELGKFLMNGSLFKGAKPIMWSIVEKTALAEAEVEYEDHTSTSIFVGFPVQSGPAQFLDTSIVIWTTTPWTIPGNRALAYGPKIEYKGLEITSVLEGSGLTPGAKIIVAANLIPALIEEFKIENPKVFWEGTGSDLEGIVCRHPLHEGGFDFPVPALAADFATDEDGTGFVHIAPGHGADDWVLGVANGVPVPDTVDDDGVFFDHVPMFAGQKVMEVGKKKKIKWPANATVITALAEAGSLYGVRRITHSYPHSWRSKAPVIFRNTPQWFISMEINDLRKKALSAIEETRFVPESGAKRIGGMIESRPDWCVSRQRAWGVPITVFVNKKTSEPLRDPEVMNRIVSAFQEEGSDAWFSSDPTRFLGNKYDPADYDQVTDILDVWFDSGCTHTFVLEGDEWPNLSWPASLYLEGSDQHRGWFHSSLLESCGTRERAPYDAVLTHGFVMAEDGRKMSKSLGNIVSPQDVVKQSGADILRLWVMSSDYADDLRVGPEIIKQLADSYRRLRNTLRFIIGNLNEFKDEERLPVEEMPELERWVLNRLWELDGDVRQANEDFQFHHLYHKLHNFCAMDLSAFYLDIRKDALYCDRSDSIRRRAARTVLDEIFNCLTAWFAPFICFTAEEAWLARNPGDDQSVHLRTFPEIPAGWQDEKLAEKWGTIRDLRKVVTGALEVERANKTIGSSLQANPVVYADAQYIDVLKEFSADEAADLFITSGVSFGDGTAPEGAFILDDVKGVAVVFAQAEGEKCQRCWKVLKDVGTVEAHPEVCPRCAYAHEHFTSQAAE